QRSTYGSEASLSCKWSISPSGVSTLKPAICAPMNAPIASGQRLVSLHFSSPSSGFISPFVNVKFVTARHGFIAIWPIILGLNFTAAIGMAWRTFLENHPFDLHFRRLRASPVVRVGKIRIIRKQPTKVHVPTRRLHSFQNFHPHRNAKLSFVVDLGHFGSG